MKTKQTAVTVDIEDEVLMWFFGPNATATIKRICADHHVTRRALIGSIVSEIVAQFEEDIIKGGLLSGGENEWAQVRNAKMGSDSEWKFLAEEKHVAGSVPFRSAFDANRIAYLKEAMGAMPRTMAVAA